MIGAVVRGRARQVYAAGTWVGSEGQRGHRRDPCEVGWWESAAVAAGSGLGSVGSCLSGLASGASLEGPEHTNTTIRAPDKLRSVD